MTLTGVVRLAQDRLSKSQVQITWKSLSKEFVLNRFMESYIRAYTGYFYVAKSSENPCVSSYKFDRLILVVSRFVEAQNWETLFHSSTSRMRGCETAEEQTSEVVSSALLRSLIRKSFNKGVRG